MNGPALWREDQAIAVAQAAARSPLLFLLQLRDARPTSEPVPSPALPISIEDTAAPAPATPSTSPAPDFSNPNPS